MTDYKSPTWKSFHGWNLQFLQPYYAMQATSSFSLICWIDSERELCWQDMDGLRSRARVVEWPGQPVPGLATGGSQAWLWAGSRATCCQSRESHPRLGGTWLIKGLHSSNSHKLMLKMFVHPTHKKLYSSRISRMLSSKVYYKEHILSFFS